jgi:hypothetical protein
MHFGLLIPMVAVIMVFASPVAITWMIINAKRKSLGASNEEFDALRAEINDLREQMAANQADVTLMLDDMQRSSLPSGDAD